VKQSIESWLIAALLGLTALPAVAAEPARGMAFEVYIRLKTGMSEAELLQRAGAPDYESDGGWQTRSRTIAQSSAATDPQIEEPVRHRGVVRDELTQPVKTWYYLPTVSDPFTTAVTLTGGRISHLDRQKKF
jgi:hypothetical protein